MDLEKALADINAIRSQVVANRQFQGFGPAIIGITGVLAALLAVAQTAWPQWLAASPRGFLSSWLLLALVCVTAIGVEMYSRARHHHGPLASRMTTNAIESFMPSGIAGAVIWGVITFYSPESSWLLPGLSHLLLGIGVFAARSYLPKAVFYVGAWFLVSGSLALLLASQTQTLEPWIMALPLAVGQGLMAAILYHFQEPVND